jgi:hypothetical protein
MLYAFRIVQEDNTISHHGMVTANSNYDLFWMIDQFVDPYAVEVKKITGLTGFCSRTQELIDDDGDMTTPIPHEEGADLEFAEEFTNTISESDGWYRAKWTIKQIIGY